MNTRHLRSCLLLFSILGAAIVAVAQEREDRVLLSWEQMRAIINEVSGERAQQAVLEMVPYPRVRPRSEYEGYFRESEVMARLAREYGFSQVEIEKFPTTGQRLWQATQAELWMVKPESRKIYDFRDVAVSIASGSDTGDVTADLVDVGNGGRPDDYAGKDVKGRIVLGSAASGTLQRFAVFERGAVGVLSYNPIHPEASIDEIGSQSVSGNAPQGRATGFGWSVSPRTGRELAGRLGRGETITLRSIVKAESFPGRMETVHAVIPGDGSSDQELAVSGHLYEGYLKQGANDDASGCALTLEMGRSLIRLVADGKLPRPKRTIHFLWVPEISGTTAWLQNHADVTKKLIADLNFDMEGLRLSAYGSFWTMHRTPDSFPTFLNDVGANIMETIANVNRERVRYRSGGYGFTLPVVAPTGSQDPFYILVEKHYGASDHVVYINNGIPSLMFITWPDPFYHSSQDTPDKLDPTQFKRAGVVGLGALAVLAQADEAMAMKVVAETLARGTERIGQAERKGLGYLADASTAAALAEALKEARNAVRHQVEIEKTALRTAAVLFPSPADGQKKLATLEPLLDQHAVALQANVLGVYKLAATRLNPPAAESLPSEIEAKAARTVVEPVAGAGGGRGGPGGAGGGPPAQTAGGAQSPADRNAIAEAMRKIPGHMTAELRAVLPRKLTVQQIRDFLSGEFEPVPVADVMAYFEAMEKSGSVKLVERVPEPVKGPKAPRKK
jgi:aminopeptidase YwaD